jgi:hypothetical protein
MGDVLGRLWIVFFLGRERGRGNSMSRTTESFSQDDTSLRTSLFSSTSTPWTDMCTVQVSTTRRPLPHTDHSEGAVAPRSVTDSTHGSVGMVSYVHVVYVTCYFCYMFSLVPSSGSSDSVRIYRSVIFGKQNWWCVRTSCT